MWHSKSWDGQIDVVFVCWSIFSAYLELEPVIDFRLYLLT